MSEIYFKISSGANQIVSLETFDEIEKSILYELYNKNITFENANKILEIIKQRLKFQFLNTKIELHPKDITIEKLRKENKELQEKLNLIEKSILNFKKKKLSKKIRDFLNNLTNVV